MSLKISQEYLDKIQEDKEIVAVYLANSLQQGYIAQHLSHGGDDNSYHIQVIWEYHNKLNIETLKKSWEMIQSRFPSLRLRFAWDESLLQIVDKENELNFIYRESRENDFVEKISHEDLQKPYELDKGNLFRIYVIKHSQDRYTCIFSYHNSVLDGWSFPILLATLHYYYQQLIRGKTVESNLDTAYCAAQKYHQKKKNESTAYWNERRLLISQKPNYLGLMKEQPGWLGQLSEYRLIEEPKHIVKKIKGSLLSSIRTFTQDNALTNNALLSYAWSKTLSIFTNVTQTSIGNTISGRNIPIDDIERSVGAFINTLPLIVDHSDKNKTLLESVHEVQLLINEMNTHSSVNLSDIQIGKERIFDSLYVFENYPNHLSTASDSEIKIEFKQLVDKLDYPLAVMVREYDDLMTFKLIYAAEIFNKESLEHILNVFQMILGRIIKEPNKKCGELSLSECEVPIKNHKKSPLFLERFQKQVKLNADHVALTYEGHQLTYKELDMLSTQLAETLKLQIDKNVKSIALLISRSEKQIIAMLATFKLGLAYLPIDTTFPLSKIQFMIEKSDTKLAILDSHINLKIQNIKTLNYDDMMNSSFEHSNGFKYSDIKPNDPAYIIFTSGSTGEPKGVLVEQGSLANLITAQNEFFDRSYKHALWFSNYVFDAHVWEIFYALSYGLTLHIANDEQRHDTSLLRDFIMGYDIELATLPPSILSKENIFPLKTLVVAGESSKKELLDCYLKHGINIINAYGPTEATVCATIHHYDGNSPTNIGKPIDQVQCYVLDDALQLLPMLAVGELCVSGAGVARGYTNNEIQTRTHFIQHPDLNTRIYKTGDLVFMNLQGDLELVGRKDNQIKLNGYRIELDAIYNTVLQYSRIKQACVLVDKQSNSSSLDLFYVLSDEKDSNLSVDHWKSLYDCEYASQDVLDSTCDIQGWKSSYTNRPIPKNEMHEWLDNISERILSLKPKNIIEIGCGKGLILFKCIEQCQYYVGSDFSNEVIDSLQNFVNHNGYKNKLRLLTCDAKTFPYKKIPPCDTIILNSVIQYFPDINYLDEVIKTAVQNIHETGQVIIGDVRDYRLLSHFHDSIKKEGGTVPNYEYELLVSPSYFKKLKNLIPEITYVDVLPKLGASNELNNYRYDVIIHVNRPCQFEFIPIEKESIPLVKNIKEHLSEHSGDEMITFLYPNPRISELDGIQSLSEIEKLANSLNLGLYYELDCNEYKYYRLTFYSLDTFSAHFVRLEFQYEDSDQPLSNQPHAQMLSNPEDDKQNIKNFLKETLPEYMLPTYYHRVKEMPLNSSAKIDRAELLRIKHQNLPIEKNDLNSNEKTISDIWSDVLGIDSEHIRVNTSFFDLGGNSISLIHLKSKLEKQLSIQKIQVSDLFKYPTIQQFAHHYLEKPKEKIHKKKTTSSLEYDTCEQDIAVIGLSGAFSGAETSNQLWERLKKSESCLSNFKPKENDEQYIPISGHINNIEDFDPNFWELPMKQAEMMDPQIRLFLQHCWHALENAGYVAQRSDIKIGVYAGCGPAQYYQTRIMNNAHYSSSSLHWMAGTLNGPEFLATQASYLLGLTGTALNINTACSTSLVSIVEACRHLYQEECEIALAGGSALMLPEQEGYHYKEGMILSKNGECRVFDKDATGTVAGSGVGVVVLKKLKKAITDQDNIIAVIKGYSTNNDGHRKMAYTAPSVVGQVECIRDAHNHANIDSSDISYIECHGTGTSLGDPVELAALREVFSDSQKPYSCFLGSIKANIGHTGAAAGIASFIKVCHMLQTNKIPPQLHYDAPNPECYFGNSGFQVNKTLLNWESSKERLAGVSSFGIGGTNAHVVVQQSNEKYHATLSLPDTSTFLYIVPLSAKSFSSLLQYVEKLKQYLQENTVSLSNLTYTLQSHREHFDYRFVITCCNVGQLIKKLNNILSSECNESTCYLHGNKQLEENRLAAEWILGEDIKWPQYRKYTPRFIPDLPGYQFEMVRCWIEPPNEIDHEKIELVNNKSKNNSIEKIVAHLMKNNLGITESEIGIERSYFHMGGTSLSSIALVEELQNHFNIALSPGMLSEYNSVSRLANYIRQQTKHYKAIVELNQCQNKPLMTMVHPGLSGCEVYQPLANKLKKNFYCLGIDAYNLYNSDKYKDINSLPKYYYNHLLPYLKKQNSDEYNLLGWSLGGIIAIEIAQLIEQNFNEKINLILLDSVIDDEVIQEKKLSSSFIQEAELHYKAFLETLDLNLSQKKHRMECFYASQRMSCYTPTTKLNNSRLILFKALQINPQIQNTSHLKDLMQYIIHLPDNNMNKISDTLEVIELFNVNHDNILEAKSQITRCLSEVIMGSSKIL